jgi:hypothetical protein
MIQLQQNGIQVINMNTYIYKPINLVSDQNGIVMAVDFSVDVSDGIDSFTIKGHTALASPSKAIIPYNELTEAEVIAWIQSMVGVATEEQADAELEAYKTRKVLSSGVPWL